jgi:hypothetical protein
MNGDLLPETGDPGVCPEIVPEVRTYGGFWGNGQFTPVLQLADFCERALLRIVFHRGGLPSMRLSHGAELGLTGERSLPPLEDKLAQSSQV